MPLAAGALLVSGKTGAKAGFIELPIVKRIKPHGFEGDLSYTAIDDAIANIIKASGSVPAAYRVTYHPYKHVNAKSVAELFDKEANICIECRCDPNQRAIDTWYLEGNGIVYLSIGA